MVALVYLAAFFVAHSSELSYGVGVDNKASFFERTDVRIAFRVLVIQIAVEPFPVTL